MVDGQLLGRDRGRVCWEMEVLESEGQPENGGYA